MPIANINTWIMHINPAGFAKYEWNVDETIYSCIESYYEATCKVANVDHNTTKYDKAQNIVGRRVFDWMNADLKLFCGIARSIPGFSIKFRNTFTHGYVGNIIEMDVKYNSIQDLIHAIKRLPKTKFDEYMEKNHSSGTGFHSNIPNSRDGLLKQNDRDYMMACYLGYRLQSRIAPSYKNDYTDPVPFDCQIACPELMNFESSQVAFNLIKFLPKTKKSK